MPQRGCILVLMPGTLVPVMPQVYATIRQGPEKHPVEVYVPLTTLIKDRKNYFHIEDGPHSLCAELYPRTIAVLDMGSGKLLWLNEGLLARNPQICGRCFCVQPVHKDDCPTTGNGIDGPRNSAAEVGG